MEMLKKWLHKTLKIMDKELIKSITGNHHYLNAFNEKYYN